MMRRKLLILSVVFGVLIVSSAALIWAGFSLRGRSPIDTTSSTATLSPRSSTVYAVDGRLADGEYDYVYEDEATGMTLAWRVESSESSVDQGLIYIGLHSPVRGRLEIAFATSGPYIAGGDVIVGYIQDGELVIQDQYGDGPTSNVVDANANGTDDILQAAGSNDPDETGTTIEFTRALVTPDTVYDKPITDDGPMRVKIGHGPFQHFTGLGGDEWTVLDVDFFEGTVRPIPRSP